MEKVPRDPKTGRRVPPPWKGAGFVEAAATGNVEALNARWNKFLAKEGSEGADEHPEAKLDSSKRNGRDWVDSQLHGRLQRTPLMVAALGGHERVVTQLLAMGVDTMLQDADGKTALLLASTEAVSALLSRVKPVADRLAVNCALLAAAEARDADGVAVALEKGAFPEAWHSVWSNASEQEVCALFTMRVTLTTWPWWKRC